MKKFILLSLFAIGLMVLWPPGEQVMAATSDQVSFVVDLGTAQAFAFIQNDIHVVYQSQLEPATILVKEKGGNLIEKSLITSLDAGYLNKNVILTTTDFTLIKNYGFRICQTLLVYESYYLIQRNKASAHRFARDGLRCRV